jgi:hypothetical protein
MTDQEFWGYVFMAICFVPLGIWYIYAIDKTWEEYDWWRPAWYTRLIDRALGWLKGLRRS